MPSNQNTSVELRPYVKREMVTGKAELDLWEEVQQKWPKVTWKKFKNLQRSIKAELKVTDQELTEDRERNRGLAIARYQHLLGLAVASNDLKEARFCLKEIQKLQGLEEPQQLQLQLPQGTPMAPQNLPKDPEEMTDEELDHYYQQMEPKRLTMSDPEVLEAEEA